MNALPNTRSCYVCGIENPIGLRLGFQSDDARTVAETRFSFRPEFAGFRDTVHGGAIATVLDEVMVWAIGVAAKQFVYCAELTVRYQRPARPGAELVARGEVTEDRRGRLFTARGFCGRSAGVPSARDGEGVVEDPWSGRRSVPGHRRRDRPGRKPFEASPVRPRPTSYGATRPRRPPSRCRSK